MNLETRKILQATITKLNQEADALRGQKTQVRQDIDAVRKRLDIINAKLDVLDSKRKAIAEDMQ